MIRRIPVAFVEHIHDVLVGVFLPFDEKINPSEHRDRGRIESALNRPFDTWMGEDFYPTISQKGAALFHSLVCNHCFINGNKRTAVLSLDMFLLINQHILVMPSDQVYLMAKETAEANQAGISSGDLLNKLSADIAASLVDVEKFTDDQLLRDRLADDFDRINRHLRQTVLFGLKAVSSFTGQDIPTPDNLKPAESKQLIPK